MTNNEICIKCQGNMILGSYVGTSAKWVGEEEYTFLEQSTQKILTYACEKCGYMESFVKNKLSTAHFFKLALVEDFRTYEWKYYDLVSSKTYKYRYLTQ